MEPAGKLSIEAIIWVVKPSSKLAPGLLGPLEAQAAPAAASAGSACRRALGARAGASGSPGPAYGRGQCSTCWEHCLAGIDERQSSLLLGEHAARPRWPWEAARLLRSAKSCQSACRALVRGHMAVAQKHGGLWLPLGTSISAKPRILAIGALGPPQRPKEC